MNRRVWNNLQLDGVWFGLDFAGVQIPGLPSCAGSVVLMLCQLGSVHEDGWGWRQHRCSCGRVEGGNKSLGIQKSCAVFTWPGSVSMGCTKGHLGAPAEYGLDLTAFLIPRLGWFLQRPCRYLWKAFATSLVLIGFANLEGALSEDIIC